MTDRKQRLAALAVRIEQLQGPDREMDAEIYATTPEAIDYQRIAIRLADASRLDRWHDGWVTVRGDKGEGDPYPEDLKPYTASLDSAETLVPTDCHYQVSSGGNAGVWSKQMGEPRPVQMPNGQKITFPAVLFEAGGKAKTAPLALTAAALRAQSETVA